MPKAKNVLVTGGCGYIGSHVARQLSEKGYSVVIFDNLATGFSDSLIHEERLVEGDTRDEGSVKALFETHPFDAVLHFAASIVVPESVEKPLLYYENNTVGTLHLLKACVQHKVKAFIFSSTAAVYGDASGTLKEPLPTIDESVPTAPTNAYSSSKLMNEWMLKDVAVAHPLSYVTLRYFNVAGADPKGRMGQRSPKATHLIKIASEVLVGKRKSLTVFGTDYKTPDGTGVRDYIHVEDLAAAHISALQYLESGGKSLTLNCGYGKGSSVLEVIQMMERVSQKKLKIEYGPRRPGDVANLVANPARLKKHFDWSPQYDSLEEICRSAYEWEKKLSKT